MEKYTGRQDLTKTIEIPEHGAYGDPSKTKRQRYQGESLSSLSAGRDMFIDIKGIL